jgi:hypothetical protein
VPELSPPVGGDTSQNCQLLPTGDCMRCALTPLRGAVAAAAADSCRCCRYSDDRMTCVGPRDAPSAGRSRRGSWPALCLPPADGRVAVQCYPGRGSRVAKYRPLNK